MQEWEESDTVIFWWRLSLHIHRQRTTHLFSFLPLFRQRKAKRYEGEAITIIKQYPMPVGDFRTLMDEQVERFVNTSLGLQSKLPLPKDELLLKQVWGTKKKTRVLCEAACALEPSLTLYFFLFNIFIFSRDKGINNQAESINFWGSQNLLHPSLLPWRWIYWIYHPRILWRFLALWLRCRICAQSSELI